MKQLIVSEVAKGTALPKSQMCKTLGVSYSQIKTKDGSKSQDTALRKAIHELALKSVFYGYRRLTVALKREYSLQVNAKRVLRIMREEHLLVKRKRSYRVVTTKSNHGLPIAPNLARYMSLDDVNQLWVGDITYIHFGKSVGYLATILDAYSRKCIGWSFRNHMQETLTLEALDMAIKNRNLERNNDRIGLVHHSDRGVQYASEKYRQQIKAYGITQSMSRKGNCYDNAKAESFNKTIKLEEVYLHEYENFDEARKSLENFLERVYNTERLHSSLGYLPPNEFESQQSARCAGLS
jgi:putative transposase